MNKPTAEQVASIFGASPESVRAQYRKNASQLRAMATQAGRGKYRGFHADKLESLALLAEDAAIAKATWGARE